MAKILIHTMIFAPDGVSTAYLYTDLAKELQRLGHSITVLTTTPHFNVLESALKEQPLTRSRGKWLHYSECEGIPVWHVSMPMKTEDTSSRIKDMLRFHAMSLYKGLFLMDKHDVVISPSPPLSIGVVAWLLARRFGGKAIYNVQELYPDIAVNQGLLTNRNIIRVLSRMEQLVYRKNAQVVTIADRFRKMIMDRGVPPSKVRTIPNFVDTDLYRPLPRDNEFSRDYGLLDSFVLLYAGNIGIFQDWETMLYSADHTRDLPIRYVVVGDGSKKRWLEQKIEEHRLKNVYMVSYQPREKMPMINASCDAATILMHANSSNDGFPSKIYTNMACGKSTIVATDEDSELSSIVDASGCGRRVPAGDKQSYLDAVLRAYAEREMLASEGLKGRAYVEAGFSKQAVAKQYDALIREITER